MEGSSVSAIVRSRDSRKSWYRWFGWSVLLVSTTLTHPDLGPVRAHAHRPVGRRPRGPNFLILVGDDHGAGRLGIDEDPRRATPRLDALARQGVRFDRAYCNSPVCTPSRQTLMTGRLPHAVGVTRLATPLPEDATTLGDWLGDLGYDTAAFGKMHFNRHDPHGFNERLDEHDWSQWLRDHPPPPGTHATRWRPFKDPPADWLNAGCLPSGLDRKSMESPYYVDRAAEFLGRHKDRSQSAPFALVVGFREPHAPFLFPPDLAGKYRPQDFPVPSTSESDKFDQPKVFSKLTPTEGQGISAAYYTSLSFLDQEVGRVLDALETSGLADDTVVIYLSDNGYLLGDHGRFEKHCFYEQAVRIPLILRWPGKIPANRRVTDLVELVDLFPTLVDLADLPTPPNLHGQSLGGLARGDMGAKGSDFVVSEYLENEEAMIRTRRYKLIVGNGTRLRRDGYATGRTLPGPYERLYDLEKDPGETKDLRSRPELAPIAEDLRQKLATRLATTRNWDNPVPTGLSTAETLRWCLVPRD